MEGVFTVRNGVIGIIESPDWSRAALARLIDSLEAARQPDADREQVLRQIESVSPETAKILRPFVTTAGSWWWVAGLILFALSQCEIKVDANRLVDQYFEHLSRQQAKDLQQQEHKEGARSSGSDSEQESKTEEN